VAIEKIKELELIFIIDGDIVGFSRC